MSSAMTDVEPRYEPSYVELRFTIDDERAADGIVGALLADHLVACGQRIGPMTSRYWWSGAIEQSDEWAVFLKTRAALAARVIERIVELHPYETPEVVVVPIVAGHAAYLDWIGDVTRDSAE